jgi:hypothetical protein
VDLADVINVRVQIINRSLPMAVMGVRQTAPFTINLKSPETQDKAVISEEMEVVEDIVSD